MAMQGRSHLADRYGWSVLKLLLWYETGYPMASSTSHMPRVSAGTLLFPFFIRLKLGFSALNRTTRISLSSNDSGLSIGMSGSRQLLSIKAQALAKNRSSPPLLLLLYALICPELTCIALSPISCFIHRSSLHLGSMYSL